MPLNWILIEQEPPAPEGAGLFERPLQHGWDSDNEDQSRWTLTGVVRAEGLRWDISDARQAASQAPIWCTREDGRYRECAWIDAA